jgi:hypothetical protein
MDGRTSDVDDRRVERIQDVHAEHDGEHGPAHRVATGRRCKGRVGNDGAHDACSASFIMAIQLWGASPPSMMS